MTIKKQLLVYTIGLLSAQPFSLVWALDAGAVNPKKQGYQLPEEPTWQMTPSKPIITLDDVAKVNEVGRSFYKRFILKQLHFKGNKSISHQQLQAQVKPLLGKAVSAVDLENIRQQLLLYYREKGFISPSVTLPSQHITEGLVCYTINEGQLVEINVKEVDQDKKGYVREKNQLNEHYVRSRITIDDKPLQKAVLLERFQQLLTDPLIDKIEGVIKQGGNINQAILDLKVTLAKPYEFHVGMDNYTPASVGAYTGNLGGVVRNLTGWGDLLQVELSGSEGMQSISSFFSIPLTSDDTRFNIAYQGSQSRIVEKPLDDLDIESQFMGFNVGISHPIFRSLNRAFSLELQYAFRQTKTSLLGTPTALGSGVEDNGKAKVSVVSFIQSHIERHSDYVLSLRSSLNVGFDAFNATIHSNSIADGRYFSWLGQLRYLHKLDDWGTELFLRSDIQLASESLLPLERFGLGGVSTIRGYRQNELVRDEGYALSLEFRIPLWQESSQGKHHLKLIPFFDYGQAWNHHQDSKTLYSAGVGLTWRWDEFNAEFYWAQALNNPDVLDQEKDAQDSGIHFQVNMQF